ncbi:MAG: TolC family protein [Planctomycetota bacterium]
MSCTLRHRLAWLLVVCLIATGCTPSQPLYLRDNGSLSHYLEQATQVEYPDVNASRLEEVAQSKPPVTVIDPDFDSFYDLTLEECVAIALQNSKVIRGYGTPSLQGSRISPGIDSLTTGSQGVGTFYSVAIRETEPGQLNIPGNLPQPSIITTNTGLDANQGVEAALAEFDAQVSSNLFWAKSDEPRNNTLINPISPQVFDQDQVTWQSQIAKKTAEGTQLFVRNSNIYTANNIPLQSEGGFQVLPSWWRANLEVEARQPLLRGRGAFINRLPILVSRIGTDQTIANLEAQLQNMVTNVEIRYWDLQAAYRNLEAAKQGRDAALKTWRVIKNQFDTPPADVTIQQYAQASEQYYFFEQQVVDAFNTLLTAESNLRWLLGIARSDGQIIRPTDEPSLAPIAFDYYASIDEALLFRPELRQQRWELKKRELAVAYAKNGLLPEVNATMLYRFLGLGEDLASYDSPPPVFPNPGSGAYNELFEGRFQELQFGLEARANVGFRRELANVRNAQLKLAQEHARMEDVELDVSRELGDALQAAAANYRALQIAFNRWSYTTQELMHFDRTIEVGVETIDTVLDAQRRNAQAEISFYTALAEYNKSIALVHRRKGTILAYNGIEFAEGPWTGKAYYDAAELARRRSASREVNYGWTRPGVISQGPINPTIQGNSGCATGDCEVPGAAMPANLNAPTPVEEISPTLESPENALPAPGEQTLRQPLRGPGNFGVRPVSYEEAVPPDSKPLTSSPKSSAPTRDPITTALGATALGATAPGATTREPFSTSQFNWEKFGVDDPSKAKPGIRATIKTDGQ